MDTSGPPSSNRSRAGTELNVIDRARGPLRRRIEPPQRLDHVTHELHANRSGVRGRKDIHDASPDCEGTVLVDGILAREPAVHEQIRQSLGFDLCALSKLHRSGQHPLRRAGARKQRGSRRDDDARRSGDGAVQRTRPRSRNTKMRGHPPIGIDLERRRAGGRPARPPNRRPPSSPP